jgi:hypothetical protein
MHIDISLPSLPRYNCWSPRFSSLKLPLLTCLPSFNKSLLSPLVRLHRESSLLHNWYQIPQIVQTLQSRMSQPWASIQFTVCSFWTGRLDCQLAREWSYSTVSKYPTSLLMGGWMPLAFVDMMYVWGGRQVDRGHWWYVTCCMILITIEDGCDWCR